MRSDNRRRGAMPKEYIEDSGLRKDLRVRVGWYKKAGVVQIATTAPDRLPLVGTPDGNGWFVTLDQQAIDRLIKVLKKARKHTL
jgi:hypothetical protein